MLGVGESIAMHCGGWTGGDGIVSRETFKHPGESLKILLESGK